jgi:hypothetical protein
MVALSQMSPEFDAAILSLGSSSLPVKTSTRCCRDAELRKRFTEFGPESLASTPARLGEPMASEIEK